MIDNSWSVLISVTLYLETAPISSFPLGIDKKKKKSYHILSRHSFWPVFTAEALTLCSGEFKFESHFEQLSVVWPGPSGTELSMLSRWEFMICAICEHINVVEV